MFSTITFLKIKMYCRVRYLFDFDLIIRSGQVLFIYGQFVIVQNFIWPVLPKPVGSFFTASYRKPALVLGCLFQYGVSLHYDSFMIFFDNSIQRQFLFSCSFLSKFWSFSIPHQQNQNNACWCYIKNDHNFERF